MNLADAIMKLDPNNADHWTQSGEARLDVLEGFMGGTVRRKDVNDLFPGLTKETHRLEATLDAPADEVPEAPAEQPADPAEEVLEEPECEGGVCDAVTPEEALEAGIRLASNDHLELTRRLEKLKIQHENSRAALMEMKKRRKAMAPAHDDQAARMEYIKSQQRARADRFAQAKKAGPAPIDAVAKRPAGHGRQRVVRPPMGGKQE